MLVLGIDPGLACTAWALAQTRSDSSPSIICAGMVKVKDESDKLVRALRIADTMVGVHVGLYASPPDVVVIERAPAMYSTRPRGAADSDLNFLIGAITYAVYNESSDETRLAFVYPATWRTQVLGAANLQPDKATICTLFDIPDPKKMLANADLRDAVCIAGWGARRTT
jgi:Holliday junction resolvasome RuvABC endonuclease subunit